MEEIKTKEKSSVDKGKFEQALQDVDEIKRKIYTEELYTEGDLETVLELEDIATDQERRLKNIEQKLGIEEYE